MTYQELAKILHGREYRNETTPEIEQIAKENNLVICFTQSDDLIEFRGAIYDEFEAYEGGNVFLVNGKILQEFDYIKTIEIANYHIKAVWAPEDENGKFIAYFIVISNVPHSTFDIMRDGEIYCRGIVFSIDEVI